MDKVDMSVTFRVDGKESYQVKLEFGKTTMDVVLQVEGLLMEAMKNLHATGVAKLTKTAL